MTLLEMGGADDQLRLPGWPVGFAPRGAVFVVFDVSVVVFDVPVEVPAVPADGFGVPAGVFVWGVCGVADFVAVRGEDDGDEVGDSDGAGEGVGGSEGCAGMPIAGASACTPTRLLPMATARIAPTTETGHPRPRNRRPRVPDWSTNTGAGAGSSNTKSDISGTP
ncbi:hypothetical protein ACFXD5_10145 [Streptomyces sp. NPDC059385]|uniref:hypothetical protein n=1 Tax=Streptomyces sp. NPDC059385 TaxID=3346817 RepID=UPI0036820D33